jgi:hypothetical protein
MRTKISDNPEDFVFGVLFILYGLTCGSVNGYSWYKSDYIHQSKDVTIGLTTASLLLITWGVLLLNKYFKK